MPFHHYLTPELVRFVVSKFKLSYSGAHGPSQWMRVRRNGLELAQRTGAKTGVDGQFVKFRLTGPIYPELKEAIKSTLAAFQHLAMLAISNR